MKYFSLLLQHSVGFLFIVNGLIAQNALTPQILPSPDAKQLGKYGSFPVNYYTGQVNVGVPLYSLEENGLNFPISLAYDASGVLIGNHPGMTGQNWAIEKGGVIVRNLKGEADELGKFSTPFGIEYYDYNDTYYYGINQGYLTYANTDSIANLIALAVLTSLPNQILDTEPDIFNFNFFGKSGKFFLAQDGNWKVISEHNLKIEFDYNNNSNFITPFISQIPYNSRLYHKVIKGFKIIDDNGYKYTFGIDQNAIEYSLPFFQHYALPSWLFPNWTAMAWHLTKVEDYRGNELYKFNYHRTYFTAELYQSINIQDVDCRDTETNWIDESFTVSKETHGSLMSPVYIDKITSLSGDSIVFKYSNAEQMEYPNNIEFNATLNETDDAICNDYPGLCSTPVLPFLQQSGYYSFDPAAALSNPLKGLKWRKLDSIKFYKKHQSLLGVVLKYGNNNIQRLRLDTVKFIANDFNINSNPQSFYYKFDYNNFNSIPTYFSTSMDHWGYNDGSPHYTSPTNTIADYNTNYYNSRESNFTTTLYGSLNKITYPTKGWSEFTYELHNYAKIVSNDKQSFINTSGTAGGLRIKEIKHYDGINPSPATSKRYFYSLGFANNSNLSSGILNYKPNYVWLDWLSPTTYWPQGGRRSSSFSTNQLITLANYSSHYIGYSEVIEMDLDNSYIIYKYTDQNIVKDELQYTTLEFDSSPFLNFSERSYLRGKLLEKTFFNNNNEKVKKENIFYRQDLFPIGGDQTFGISASVGAFYFCFPSHLDDDYYTGNATKIYHNKLYTDSIVNTFYFAGDSVKIVDKHTFTLASGVNFGNNNYYLSSKEISNSDGIKHKTTYEYPFNHSSSISGQSIILQNLSNSFRLNIPVIERQFTNNILVAGILNEFELFNSFAEVYKINKYEYTWNGFGIGSGNWQLNLEIPTYNTQFIKPTSKISTGWLTENITLSSSGNPLTWTYGSHTKSMQYYTNTYIDEYTDSDGQKLKYDFDKFNRIKKVTQLPKNNSSNFTYTYGNNASVRSFFKRVDKFNIVVPNSEIDSTVSITYLDGLGRDIQMLNKYGSPSLQDVLIRVEYDNVGRIKKNYIPVEISNNNGNFVLTPPNVPFKESTYYVDGLNRLHTETPPTWYSTNIEYSTNSSSLTSPWGIIFPKSSFFITTTIDSDNKKNSAYQDKIGRKVLEVRSNSDGSQAVTTWTQYDGKNRVSKVYPPGTSTSTPNLIFEYRYDGDDNIIYKKVPDAAAEEYVYDVRNLMIGMRNARMQAMNKWLVTHYDDYGRPIKRGYHNLTGSLPNTPNPIINTLLEENFYDGYNGSTTNSAAIYKGKLKKNRTKALDDLAVNTTWIENELFYDAYGRINNTSGINHRGQAETHVFTYDFADNILTDIHNITGPDGVNHTMKHQYDHQGRKIYDITNLNGGGEKTLGNYVYNYKNEIIEKNLGRFATTGTMQYLQSIDYSYNDQGWLTKINDLFAGTLPMGPDPCDDGGSSSRPDDNFDITTTDDADLFALDLSYDTNIGGSFPNYKNGNISKQTWWHKGQYNQNYGYKYDFLDRVIDAKHNDFANHPMSPERYTEKFDYDLRGNITTLNRKGVAHRPDLDDQCYKVGTIDSLQYNYVSGTNRLNTIIDKAPCPDIITLPAIIDRDANYAANQQIIVDHTTVKCNAYLHLTVGNLSSQKKIDIIDSFKIPTHCAISPAVRADIGPCPDIKYTPGFNQQSTAPYQYDASGNTTFDPNKNLTFQYNHLNLPYKIVGGENDELQLLYAADGSLLQRKYLVNSIVKHKVDYIGDKEYHNDTLEYIHHGDGRIIKQGNTFEYEYNIKDHLGNVRVTFADKDNNNTITATDRRSRNDYYSFGMQHYNAASQNEYAASKNNYKYNGKEVFEEMNLGLYMYGFRYMDPVVGRFTSVDPLANKFSSWSPYNYATNNPINVMDPDGRDTLPVNSRVTPVAPLPLKSNTTVTTSKTSSGGVLGTVGQRVLGVIGFLLSPANGNIGPNQTTPLNSIEIFTTEPSTLSDDYLAGVRERIESKNATQQDYLYAKEAYSRAAASSGNEPLIYKPSPKHAIGGWDTFMDLDDLTAQIILNSSMLGGKQRYGYTNNKVYEFKYDNAGGWHGYPIPGNQAPPNILESLRDSNYFDQKTYKKLIKQSKF